MRFDDAGLHVAVGTSTGLVALYDLRAQHPLLVKDHMYGAPIKDIKFHSAPGDGMGASRRCVDGGGAGLPLVQAHVPCLLVP